MPESRHRRRRSRGGSGSRAAVRAPVTSSRRRKTNYLYLAASALIAVLVIGSFAITGALGVLGKTNVTGSSDTYVEGVGVKHDIMPTRNHVVESQSVQYNSVPATSGDHWARWNECGFYEDEIPDERVVHNLEHSNIVVSYNLTDPDEINQLRDVLDGIPAFKSMGVARLYTKILEGHVALAAWGVSDEMVGVKKERIKKFFDTYAGTLGPEGNISCLNSGTMNPPAGQ